MLRALAGGGQARTRGMFHPVERPRVRARLREAASFRIIALIAPAGYGKSVALRQFLAGIPRFVLYEPVAEATSLAPFVRGFARALADAVPELAATVGSALDALRGAESPGRELAGWAAQHLAAADLLIAIDDVHVGEDDAQIAHFLNALVRTTPGTTRWLFSSRTSAGLALASWLAYGEADLAIDAEDLAFSREEARASAKASGVAVRDEELAAVLDLVEGWPAAFAFALRTSARAEDLRALRAGTRDLVYRYLAEQVWDDLPERDRALLRTAAFLPRLETRYLIAAGFDDAEALIAQLRERVAFVSPVAPGVYRLHDLFAEFTRHIVALEGDEQHRRALLRAADLLIACGEHAAALERLIEVRDVERIVAVLEAHTFGFFDDGTFDVVERALRAVPTGPLLTRPKITALRAVIEDGHGRTEQALRWYAKALTDAGEDRAFRIGAAVRFGTAAANAGSLAALPALEALRDAPFSNAAERTDLLGVLAITYAFAGRLDDAQSAIAEVLAELPQLDDDARVRSHARAASLAFFTRNNAEYEKHGREGARLALELGAIGAAARLIGGLIPLYTREGDAAGTVATGREAAAYAIRCGDLRLFAYATTAIAKAEAERGDFSAALAALESLRARDIIDPPTAFSRAYAHTIGALAGGRWAEAERLMRAMESSAVYADQRLSAAAYVALAAAARGDAPAAKDAVARFDLLPRDALSTARADGMRSRIVALADALIGRVTLARRRLRANPDIAHPQVAALDRAVRAALDGDAAELDAGCRDLHAVQFGGVGAFVHRVAQPLIAPVIPADANALTATEREVLRLMAEGCTNKAIAERLDRGINTVRTHVVAILRKLGAANRGEAAALARERGLL